MSIEIQELRYVYSPKTPFEKIALDDVTLTVEDGDFFGIIGHTGSGKSTLISHFNALTRVQHGRITVDGTDITPKKIDFKSLRSRVGMVFQYPEYQLFAETVREDVAFGAKNIGIKGDELDTRVKSAIEMVGLDYADVAERSPFDLSGGQKRRVALAGVLAMHPKILVLDEPTAGLDPRGKRDILNLITEIKSALCPTVIMISHNMDEVAEYCDKIAVMANGELKFVSTPRELFSRADTLEELHIETPCVTALARELNGRGLNVSVAALTEDELVEEILRAKGANA